MWGFAQLAGTTEYPYATLQSSLQLAALAATTWSVQLLLTPARLPTLLNALAWFGFLLSITSVLAYYTSPGQVLWLIDARYPDVWGPFLSRNNFAQFLEITLPVALWLALDRPAPLLYWAMAATMLAAGLASASRAGAILLCLETLAVFLLAPRRNVRRAALFCAAVFALAVLAGAQTLLHRFTLGLLDERSQIYQSSLAMIFERPWTGYGLGSYASVYPEFALFDSGYTIDHAHSDWLEWTAEGGLAFTALWAALFFPVARKLRANPWALGIASVLLHALADFPMARLGIATWIFFLTGALNSPPPFRRTLVNTQTLKSALALALSLHLTVLTAAPAPIGTVLANGAFRVDHATITGNATLLENSLLETAVVPSSIQLHSGARVALASNSRSRLFGDRLVLEKGAANLENSTNFRLLALGLTVQPERGASTGSVILESPSRLRVSAATGSFHVLNASGQLIANLAAGSALAFEPQQGPSNVARVSGCLENKSGHYLMTDEVTNVTVEIAGNGVAQEAGNKVEVTGAADPTATPANNASQLVRAREIRRVSKGCGATPVAAAAGTGGTAAAASHGVAVSTIAIVGGVAAAAVVGGFAATSPQSDAPNPASR